MPVDNDIKEIVWSETYLSDRRTPKAEDQPHEGELGGNRQYSNDSKEPQKIVISENHGKRELHEDHDGEENQDDGKNATAGVPVVK